MPLAERSVNIVSVLQQKRWYRACVQANCVGTAMITSQSHRKLYKWAWGKVLVVAKSGSTAELGFVGWR